MPTVSVRLHGAFAEFAGARRAEVDADTVGAALAALVDRHPPLRERLRDEHGAIREHVAVFANEDEVRTREGEATPLRDGDVLHIIPALSGGRR